MGKTNLQVKRCIYCGRFFKPDNRVGERQKSCRWQRCKAKRKKESQRRWLEANPGYFKGRYENTKQWREKHPNYQSQWRANHRQRQDERHSTTAMKVIRLFIPQRYLQGEIQDEIRLVRRCECGSFIATDTG